MARQPTPTISLRLPDGTLIELVYDAEARTTALAVGRPGSKPVLQDRFELPDGERLIPYAPTNNLLVTGTVVLPSAIGPLQEKTALIASIKAFLHRHVDMSPLFEDIAAHYVLFSWVHDAFNEAPMLRLRGDLGSGKTRALLAIGSLCHKAFFASGASTVSPIFHILDTFGGTLALDEADLRYSDTTADLVKILNNGTTRGLPVLRTMVSRNRELNPTAFRVFGPKIVAMRESFDDDALESRFLTEEMGTRPLRADIALTTSDCLRSEAQELRNRLLSWRFAMLSEIAIDPSRAISRLSPRGNQMALPLLALMDDAQLRDAVGQRLMREEARARGHRARLPHVQMISVLEGLFAENCTSSVPIARVTEAYNNAVPAMISAKATGHILRTRLGLQTQKSGGIYVIPEHERARVAELAAKYGAQSL